MQTSEQKIITARRAGQNTWLESTSPGELATAPVGDFKYNVLDSEQAVGEAMFDELVRYSSSKEGDIVIVLLGGRGAQAMYRLVAE